MSFDTTVSVIAVTLILISTLGHAMASLRARRLLETVEVARAEVRMADSRVRIANQVRDEAVRRTAVLHVMGGVR